MGEISDRDELELMFGKRILELTRERRNRLIVLLGSPPNPLNVPQSFWMETGREMYSRVIVILTAIAAKAAIEHGATEFQSRLIARQQAEKQAADLIAGWIDHSQEILKTHSASWSQPEASISGASPASKPPTRSDAIEVADTIFGPERVGRMASTETTVAQTQGAEQAVETVGGISPNDLWFTREDGKVCTVCRPLHETTREFWSQFVPSGPPAHPDCRCYLLYENLGEIRGGKAD